MHLFKVVSVFPPLEGFRSYIADHEKAARYEIGKTTLADEEMLALGLGLFTFESVKHAMDFDSQIDGISTKILEGAGEPIENPLDFCLDPFGVLINAQTLLREIEYRDTYKDRNWLHTSRIPAGTVIVSSFTPTGIVL